MDDFLLRARRRGSLTLISGPLGVFVVWLRMAYFGDTLAHSALLGIALGLLLEVDLQLSVLGTRGADRRSRCSGFSTAAAWPPTPCSAFSRTGHWPSAWSRSAFVTTYASICWPYLLATYSPSAPTMLWIWGGAPDQSDRPMRIWRPLLNLSVHAELGRSTGHGWDASKLTFMLLVALVIAGRDEAGGGC